MIQLGVVTVSSFALKIRNRLINHHFPRLKGILYLAIKSLLFSSPITSLRKTLFNWRREDSSLGKWFDTELPPPVLPPVCRHLCCLHVAATRVGHRVPPPVLPPRVCPRNNNRRLLRAFMICNAMIL